MTTAVDPKYFARHYPAEPEPFPAPLVTTNDPLPAGVTPPGPVSLLIRHAAGLEWRAWAAYSKGWLPHATHGRPIGPKELWSVRLERHGQRAVAVCVDGAWSSFWLWSPERIHHRAVGLEAFKREIGRIW